MSVYLMYIYMNMYEGLVLAPSLILTFVLLCIPVGLHFCL